MRVRPPKKRADSPLVEFLENRSFLKILLKTSASIRSQLQVNANNEC
jgi:hypothetical protein